MVDARFLQAVQNRRRRNKDASTARAAPVEAGNKKLQGDSFAVEEHPDRSGLIAAITEAREFINQEKPLMAGMMPYVEQRNVVATIAVILPTLLSLFNATFSIILSLGVENCSVRLDLADADAVADTISGGVECGVLVVSGWRRQR
jgi:hypothetical protein